MRSPYRLLGLTLLPLIRWRIREISGLEHVPTSGPFIVAANHQSWIDSAIVAGALYNHIPASLRFIAQSSKYRFLGGIPINEYDKRKVIEVAYGYLRAGHPVVIFPEGNSNKNPELRTGKTGAARLALHSGRPVIPLGIQGTQGVKGWQALAWFFQFWKPCRVTIGQSLTFPKADITAVGHDRLMAVTYQIMERISHYSGKPYLLLEQTPFQAKKASWIKRFLHAGPARVFSRRLRLLGLEHLPLQGPFIIASNHSSYFDPPALIIALIRERQIHPYFITKASIAVTWRKILGSGAFDVLGMLPIDTKDRSQVLQASIDHLLRGGVVGIFPEGTRNKPRLNADWATTMLKAKTGLARLVLSLPKDGPHIPVIPVGINAPRGWNMWQTIGGAMRWWQPITITFGPPVNFVHWPSAEPTKEELDAMMRDAMMDISSLSGLKYPY